MKKLLAVISILVTTFAHADLVKIDGYLRSVDPTSGETQSVVDTNDNLIPANRVEIISANLIIRNGYLYSVDPLTARTQPAVSRSGSHISSKHISR